MCLCVSGRRRGVGVVVHVHLGLSSRPELISVEREREGSGRVEREGRLVGSGWLATCPDDISRAVCVCAFCGGWREWEQWRRGRRRVGGEAREV